MLLNVKEPRTTIDCPEKVSRILSRALKSECHVDRDKEHFWSIGLTTRNRIKYVELVSLGTLNASLVHPRELFRRAIFKAVSSIVVAHNHPSGNDEPSFEDINLTKRLCEAGKIIGIDIVDHVILTPGKHKSFRELGHL